PLSHTMNQGILAIRINGELASELMINCLTAAWENVPIRFVSGDKGLCDWIKGVIPDVRTLAVSEGVGNGSISIQPTLAVRRIRELVEESFKIDREKIMYPLPSSFEVEGDFRPHYTAKRAGFYPGAEQTGPRSVRYRADKYTDVLTFFSFTL
ncbi:MAG: M55 family metallopeptidase, partial [Clostridia bacterium]|nr:M55 family metallopeptidase [Clostridia bacterium]